MTNSIQKILITGASGYLAHRLLPVASAFGEVIGVARRRESVCSTVQAESLDLTDPDSIDRQIRRIRPEVIIHAAASNPGVDESQMNAVNHLASAAIAAAAAKVNSRLVMVSTDVVHNGANAPYADDAPAAPINTYGRTKALGEQSMLAVKPDAAIVRTSLIYGLEKMDRGTQGFAERLQRGEPLVLFNDVLRQPVWIDTLSQALVSLACEHTHISGVMNVVGSQVMSRAEFAREMLAYWSIEATDMVTERSGQGISGLPLDLRSECSRAAALAIPLPGVTEVVSSR